MAAEERPKIGTDWNSLLGSTIEIIRGGKWKIARVMDLNVRHVTVLIDGETENTRFTKVSLRGQWREHVRQFVGWKLFVVFFFWKGATKKALIRFICFFEKVVSYRWQRLFFPYIATVRILFFYSNPKREKKTKSGHLFPFETEGKILSTFFLLFFFFSFFFIFGIL